MLHAYGNEPGDTSAKRRANPGLQRGRARILFECGTERPDWWPALNAWSASTREDRCFARGARHSRREQSRRRRNGITNSFIPNGSSMKRPDAHAWTSLRRLATTEA